MSPVQKISVDDARLVLLKHLKDNPPHRLGQVGIELLSQVGVKREDAELYYTVGHLGSVLHAVRDVMRKHADEVALFIPPAWYEQCDNYFSHIES